MPVLRNRKISPLSSPNSSSSKTLELGFIPPKTPSKFSEKSGIRAISTPNSDNFGADSSRNSTRVVPSSAPRRSPRLASRMNSDGVDGLVSRPSSGGNKRQKNERVDDVNGVGVQYGEVEESCVRVLDEEKRKVTSSSSDGVEVEMEGEGVELDLSLRLRSATRLGRSLAVEESECDARLRKGKGVLIEEDDGGGIARALEVERENENSGGIRIGDEGLRSWPPRRFTWEEKGKGVASGVDSSLVDFDLNLSLDYYSMERDEMESDGDSMEMDEMLKEITDQDRKNKVRDQFKRIAKQNAVRLAHYKAEEEEEVANTVVSEDEDEDEDEDELPQAEEPVGNVEDWPGPFSTALKVFRDREKNLKSQAKDPGSKKGEFPLVYWVPKSDKDPESGKKAPPKLKNLCLDILSQHVDAISSLYCVPDALKNQLTRMLCDSRKMNPHFLDLLLEYSPVEIRLSDCSWMEERVFEKSFEACDTSNLTVLQLDLSGHCVSDASLKKVLTSKKLSALTSISLRGACRMSDVGLATLISSAPALRSLNLSDCSLLSDFGIDSIATLLGAILEKLYLDNCTNLDAKRILPLLKRMKSLEVLSLKGMVSISDKFIREFICSNGQNIKVLILAECVKLTDYSLKVIAETCSQLRVLDLSQLGKLTDTGMAYLTNGCCELKKLELRRCRFSDDAIAAFLEEKGRSLTELSLNYVNKVGQNTTLSLAKCCKNLESLDLSWCRRLTDEALGYIADNCSSLRLLNLFGCTQVSNFFVEGHSNSKLHIVGLKLTPILKHIERPEFQQGYY